MRETIKNPSLEIFEIWSGIIDEYAGDGTASFGTSSTIANDKKLFARLNTIGTPTRSKDLEGNETSTSVTVQVEYFSTVGLNKLYELDEIGHKALVDLGFTRQFGPEPVDNIDTSIKRLLSRYTLLYTGQLS